MEVNIHEAKTHVSKLLRRVAAGEEIVISTAGRPVAKIVPIARQERRRFGVDRGVFQVPDDFDAPLPAEVVDSFESSSHLRGRASTGRRGGREVR
jgi:prevent-host-death family protein